MMSRPQLWWSYKNNLDDDLVVITPPPENTKSPFISSELPLAKNPKFPTAQNIFMNNLILHSQVAGQKAMLKAMSLNH